MAIFIVKSYILCLLYGQAVKWSIQPLLLFLCKCNGREHKIVSDWTGNIYREGGAQASVWDFGPYRQFLHRRGAQIRWVTVLGLREGNVVRQVIFIATNTKLYTDMCRKGHHFVFFLNVNYSN